MGDQEPVGSCPDLQRLARDGSRWEDLSHKSQSEGLTGDEQRMVEALLQQYERLLLVRAEALARLKERGCDVAPLLEPQTE